MTKFPVDAPQTRVVKAFEYLGFCLLRLGIHIAMERENPDGAHTACMKLKRAISSEFWGTM